MAMHEEFPNAHHVFDGGSMDCGSGLILLIRQNMLQVPSGGVLEIRSSEPTVESELPPWCRMVGHIYLQSAKTEAGAWRHWVQRGTDDGAERAELESDKQKAQQFKWNLRARRTTELATTVYSRNFSWKSGSSVDFDRSGELTSSLEQFFGAFLADVINCFSLRCSRSQIVLDELEGTLNGTLNDSLAAAGIEDGDSSVKEIKLVVYVTSPAASVAVQREWDWALLDSPVFQTLKKSCEIDSRIVLL
jgi:TusA-related sulfurtransferase